jgi:hypothetical protein
MDMQTWIAEWTIDQAGCKYGIHVYRRRQGRRFVNSGVDN